MLAFQWCVYALAGFAVLTGGMDLVLGLEGQRALGAHLAPEGFRDPLLASQFRYLGTMWLGFGAALFLFISNPERYAAVFMGAMAVAFLGGLGRLAAFFQRGLPGAPVGRVLVVSAMGVELLGTPLLAWWWQRLTVPG